MFFHFLMKVKYTLNVLLLKRTNHGVSLILLLGIGVFVRSPVLHINKERGEAKSGFSDKGVHVT